MMKTQVQIPDHLYLKAKEVARSREISLAEVVRRGLEYITAVYPPIDTGENGQIERWSLPSLPRGFATDDIDAVDLKATLDEDVKI